MRHYTLLQTSLYTPSIRAALCAKRHYTLLQSGQLCVPPSRGRSNSLNAFATTPALCDDWVGPRIKTVFIQTPFEKCELN